MLLGTSISTGSARNRVMRRGACWKAEEVPSTTSLPLTAVIIWLLMLCDMFLCSRTNVVGRWGSRHPSPLRHPWSPWGRRCFVRWVALWYRDFSTCFLDSTVVDGCFRTRTFCCMFPGFWWGIWKINCEEAACLWYIREVTESSLLLQNWFFSVPSK